MAENPEVPESFQPVAAQDSTRSVGATQARHAAKHSRSCVHCPDMAATTRPHRIDVRVSAEQDAMIREAAALAGQTVTGFLLDAAQDRAREVIDERRDLVMSKAAFARFAEALDAPGEPVPELVELFGLPRIPAA